MLHLTATPLLLTGRRIGLMFKIMSKDANLIDAADNYFVGFDNEIKKPLRVSAAFL